MRDRLKRVRMKLNTKIEISLAGAMLLAAAVGALAIATNRLVESIATGESGSGDWSIDEKEFSLL